jgi:plastocyanin
MRRRIALLLTGLPLVLMLGWAAAGSVLAGDPCFHSEERPATSSGNTVGIAIGDCVFSPTVTSVPVGTTVEWTNRSFQAHEVVGSNLTWGAHEKLLNSGDTIGWTFDKAGVYAYSCMLHPGMTGAIVVGSPDLTLASDVQAASTGQTSATTETNAVPLVAAGGLGLLAGLIVGGAVVSRRRGTEPGSLG